MKVSDNLFNTITAEWETKLATIKQASGKPLHETIDFEDLVNEMGDFIKSVIDKMKIFKS